MLLKTYQKIIETFASYHGYMSFQQLKADGITILQVRELEQQKVLEKFTRGWYWCSECGYTKPADHKYVEIAKMNPDAVICLGSAGYLNGLLEREPEVIQVATARGDRRKMEIEFPISRHYFSNMGMDGDVLEKVTPFGAYRYFGKKRTVCDCMRIPDQLSEKEKLLLEQIHRDLQKEQKQFAAYERACRKSLTK